MQAREEFAIPTRIIQSLRAFRQATSSEARFEVAACADIHSACLQWYCSGIAGALQKCLHGYCGGLCRVNSAFAWVRAGVCGDLCRGLCSIVLRKDICRDIWTLGGSGSLGGGEEEVNLLQELQSLTGPRPMGLANLIRILREPFSLRHSAGAISLSNSHVAQATSALRNKCGYVVH